MAGFLLDTHVLLWWLGSSVRLSDAAREVIDSAESRLLWSAASTWELAIKTKLGKLHVPQPLDRFIPKVLQEQGLVGLAVEHAHAALVERLPLHHRDPFDRLLVAQALCLDIPIVSADAQLRPYGARVIW